MNNSIQPVVIHIEAEGVERDAVVYGKPSWTRVCLYAAVMALAFGVGIKLCDWLRLFGY